MVRLKIHLFLLLCHLNGVFSCYKADPEYVYSYHWKNRKEPIHADNDINDLIALCPDGCGPSCTIPDCDDLATIALGQAHQEVKNYQALVKDLGIYVIIRSVFLIIIVLMNIYLFCKGHYRIRDLYQRDVETQWQTEEDPTSGLEMQSWANMGVTAKQTKDPNAVAEENDELNRIPNPILKGKVFWRFRKILNLFYGRERYYRVARKFNPIRWQLENLKTIVLDGVKEKEEPEAYDWDADKDLLLASIVTPEPDSVRKRHVKVDNLLSTHK